MKGSPGRKQRRLLMKQATTKGFGQRSKYFWKKVSKNRSKKKMIDRGIL